MESTDHPPSGLWIPRPLQKLYYGPDTVQKHLVAQLPTKQSKAFIITGNSLASKTPLVQNVEELLGAHHAGTFSKIGQHAPIAQLDEATELVMKDSTIDTIISLGGGSPIDSAKAISHRLAEKNGKTKWLFHITIPTTLSAAECTHIAGYTQSDGVKVGIGAAEIVCNVILYDPEYARYTPKRLWLSTGMRAMDHAMETLYHNTATEVPAKASALYAAATLFRLLPEAHKSQDNDADLTTRLFLAAYASLGFIGLNLKGGLGLSHSLGYALGSPYQIPHGETSCLTLGHVVKLKAKASKDDAEQIARVLPLIGGQSSGDVVSDAEQVGDRILELVKDLGLVQSLTDRGVGRDQIETIVDRATGGGMSAPGQVDAVRHLVEGLY